MECIHHLVKRRSLSHFSDAIWQGCNLSIDSESVKKIWSAVDVALGAICCNVYFPTFEIFNQLCSVIK